MGFYVSTLLQYWEQWGIKQQCSFSHEVSNGTTGRMDRKPPPFSQGSGAVDVPGSHYCKSSEPSGELPWTHSPHFLHLPLGSLLSPAIWKSRNYTYADPVIIFWAACSLLPRCLPTLMGEQLLPAVYRPAKFLTPTGEKNKWKFSICSHRSFYISRRASPHTTVPS